MKIVKASLQDIPNIMNMFSECINRMVSQGIHQWNELYPTSLTVEDDIANDRGYVIVGDGYCKSYFTINDVQPTEYGQVTWSDDEGKHLVIHRLAVHPNCQGQGIASRVMDFIENEARKNKYNSIRLDVFSVNIIAQKLYSDKGFKYRGQVTFPFREQPFYCMERN